MTISPNELFNYLRGAVRGGYGSESFRGKAVLFIGMGEIGQEMLARLCIDKVDLYFTDTSIENYYAAHTVCVSVAPYTGAPVDITLDFHKGILSVNGKRHLLERIGKEPYTQGIHDFYF